MLSVLLAVLELARLGECVLRQTLAFGAVEIVGLEAGPGSLVGDSDDRDSAPLLSSLDQPTRLMTPLAQLLEAALFASGMPGQPFESLAALDADATPESVEAAIAELRSRYDEGGHGIEIVEAAGGWQILTRPEYTAAIERAQIASRPQRLSAAALETLALIAYRQPITRADIEEIRGVSAGSILKSLLERGLVDVVGKAEALGRPLLYGTTPAFLEHFALRHLGELPRADELAVALRPAVEAAPAPAS